MTRSLILLLSLAIPLLLFSACSGSEETQSADTENQEEFSQVDDESEPMLPEEQSLPEVQRMPEEPGTTSQELEQKYPDAQKRETQQQPELPVATREESPAKPALQTAEPAKNTGLMMWSVQIGAFKDEQGAVKLVQEARQKLSQPLYKDYDPVTGFFKVTVGSFTTQEQASRYKQEIRTSGYPDAFTVEVRR